MLKEKIDQDYISAYKARDERKISVLRLIKSAIKNTEISTKKELTDLEVIQALKKEAKQRKDTIDTYEKANRDDAASKEKDELLIIESYLPKQLSEAELKVIIEEKIKKLNISNTSQMGPIIGSVMAEYGSQTDGGMVSKIVRDILSK